MNIVSYWENQLQVNDKEKGGRRWVSFQVLLRSTLESQETPQRSRYLHKDVSPACRVISNGVTLWRWTRQFTVIYAVHSGEEHSHQLGLFSLPKCLSCWNPERTGQSHQGGSIFFPGEGSLPITVLWGGGDQKVCIEDTPCDQGASSLPFLLRGRALRKRSLFLNGKHVGSIQEPGSPAITLYSGKDQPQGMAYNTVRRWLLGLCACSVGDKGSTEGVPWLVSSGCLVFPLHVDHMTKTISLGYIPGVMYLCRR